MLSLHQQRLNLNLGWDLPHPPTLDLSAGSQPWRHPSRVSWAFQMQRVHIRSRPVTLRPERGTGGLPQLSWRPESPLLSVGGQVVR